MPPDRTCGGCIVFGHACKQHELLALRESVERLERTVARLKRELKRTRPDVRRGGWTVHERGAR